MSEYIQIINDKDEETNINMSICKSFYKNNEKSSYSDSVYYRIIFLFNDCNEIIYFDKEKNRDNVYDKILNEINIKKLIM